MNHLGGHLFKTHIDPGVLKYLYRVYFLETMLDIGCGPGGMLKLGEQYNLQCTGIDGDLELRPYWKKDNLNVIEHDFTMPIDLSRLNRNYDLGWSVEFVEHVDQEFENNFMKVFQLCTYVVCVPAPPGTPGHHHVNCQSEEYWIDKFKHYGFEFDEKETKSIRNVSSMKKPFMKRSGLFFYQC